MQIAFFIFYLLLFSWMIPKLPFFKHSGLSATELIILFAIKIVAGIAYGYYFSLPAQAGGSDTWRYFHQSISDTQLLQHHPLQFIRDIYYNPFETTGNIFSANHTFWNNLKSNSIVKLLAVCNLFSGSRYYVNVIFFNFIFLFGPVAWFRLANCAWTINRWLLIICCFLIPGFLFWCSGIHKDGILFSALAVLLLFSYRGFVKGFNIKQLVVIFFCCAIIFIFRNYVLIALIPAWFCWYCCDRYQLKTWKTFTIVYTIVIAVFFLTILLPASFNLPQQLINKNIDFQQIEGRSRIVTPSLSAHIISFIQYLPTAIDIALFRPHPSEIHSAFQLLAAIEQYIIVVLFLLMLLKRKRCLQHPALLLCCLFFIVSVFLISGYTICFSGAVVRYKSLYFPFIATVCFAIISFNKKDEILEKN